MKFFLRSLLFCVFFAGSVNANAEEVPAWLQPEVLKAALEIGMTDEQQPQFQSALTTYLQDMGKMVQKVIATNKGNLNRELKRRNRSLVKAMDERMASFLTPDQIPAYEIYRDKLQEHLF